MIGKRRKWNDGGDGSGGEEGSVKGSVERRELVARRQLGDGVRKGRRIMSA